MPNASSPATQPHSRARLLLLVPALLILLAGADLAFFRFAPLCRLAPAVATAPLHPADAGAVLFNDFGRIPPGINTETARRVNHAIALYRQGTVRHLIMAGGARAGLPKSGAALMAAYAEQSGLPATAISIDHGSLDSTGNLVNIRRIMAEHHWQRLLLVSSPSHLQRLQRLRLLPATPTWSLSPYDPSHCDPQPSRVELWLSVHRNLLAELLWRLLPETGYQKLVAWVRHHTPF